MCGGRAKFYSVCYTTSWKKLTPPFAGWWGGVAQKTIQFRAHSLFKRTSFLSFKMTSLPLTYKANNCYINAFINKTHHYKDKTLKMVIGSFAINGWFEFGGKHWTKADFAKKIHGVSSDSHCWLEDADGNVYDFIFPEYNFWVGIRTRKPMRRTGLVEGVSKADLLADGIEYVPAPLDAQLLLATATGKFVRNAVQKLISGEARWHGDYFAEAGTMSDLMACLAGGSTPSGGRLEFASM